MNGLDDIAKSIEMVRESVAVIKAAANDREEWAARFESASSDMLTLAEGIQTALADVERVFSTGADGPVSEVIKNLKEISSRTTAALENAIARIETQLNSGSGLADGVQELSTGLASAAAEIHEVAVGIGEIKSGVIVAVSESAEKLRGATVDEVSKLALSLAALHDTLPRAVADVVGEDTRNVQSDIERLERVLSALLTRTAEKTAADVGLEVFALAEEVRETQKLLAELLARKKGLFRA